MSVTSSSRVALSRQGVPLEARLEGNVGQERAATATLDGDACCLGSYPAGADDDAGHLDQASHVL